MEKLDGMFLTRIRKDTGNPQVKEPAGSLSVFFREIQIIKGDINFGEVLSCIYWNLYCRLCPVENICLKLVSLCLSVLLDVQSHQYPECN